MKICILQPYLTPYRVKLFDNIGRLHSGDTIICYYSKYEKRRKWEEKYELANCKEFSLKSLTIQTGYAKNFDLPNINRIIHFLKKEQPDLIVCFPNVFGFIILILSLFFKYKLISWLEITGITEASTGLVKRTFRNLFWNQCLSFIIPGKETMNYLKNLGFPKKKQRLYFAPNSVNSEFQITENELNTKLNSINNHLVLYYSGSLIKQKGVDILYKAINIVNKEYHGKRSYQLNILGTGNIRDNQIGNIIFHGFQTGDNYLNVIQRSHVFILPSFSDCNPLTVIEALKNGCILLLSKNVGNATDYIKDNGYVFESLTAREISRQIISLLECSQEHLKKMSFNSCAMGENISHFNSAKKFLSATGND